MNTETLKLEEITKWGYSFGTPSSIEQMEEMTDLLNEVDDELYMREIDNIRKYVDLLNENNFNIECDLVGENDQPEVQVTFTNAEGDTCDIADYIDLNIEDEEIINAFSQLAENYVEYANEAEDVKCNAYAYLIDDAINNN